MELLRLSPLSLILVLTGFLFFIAGLIHYYYPPKRINHFYGYRTKRSMRNLTVWKFAQTYAAKKMQRLGLYLVVLGLLASVVEIDRMIGTWLAIALVVLAPIPMLLEIEKELKKRFPKDED